MTTDTTPDNSAASTGLPNLAAEHVASAREHWTSLGYSADAFDLAMAGPPVGSEAPADASPVEVLGNVHTPTLDAGQAQEMAAALIAAGVPEDQVKAALAADGFAPAPEDTRTDEQREFDRAFGGAKPSEYQVSYMGRAPVGMDPAALAVFNAAATAWASEVGLPAGLGASFLEHAIDVGQANGRRGEAARELFKREQQAIFERQAGGPEKAAERMALARTALARGGREFTEILHKSGALDDAWTVLTLANQAERLAAR